MEADLDIEALYQDHREGLTRFAIGLSRNLDRADDLVQETFMRALMHTEDLGSMNSFQRDAWLKRVLRNCFFDEERSRKRRQTQVKHLISDHRRSIAGADLPDFESLLDLVSVKHQDVFRKRYQLGMNSKEIARDLDLSPGTVRYWLHQSITALRTQLPLKT